MIRRVGAVAGSAALALSTLVVLATPANAASHVYTTCTGTKAATHASLSPGISTTTQDSYIKIDAGSGFNGCTSSTGETVTNVDIAGAGKTFKPGDCASLAAGTPRGKILFLGTSSDSFTSFEGPHGFTATWKNGATTLGTSTGVIKAKSTGESTPLDVIVVLKITGGMFLSPDSTKPTKVKSTDVTFSLDPGEDCFNVPITGVGLSNVNPYVVSRKL